MSILVKKILAYIRYLAYKTAFILSGKRYTGDMKRARKDFVFYTMLKPRYKKIIRNAPLVKNTTHEYSDIVWWLWLQGEESAPDICKSCLASLRRHLPERKIIVLTEKNLWNYVDFPEYIKEKYRKGYISNAHFSDLVRVQLLAMHGGLWIDSTVYLTSRPDYAFDIPLFVFKNGERADDSNCLSSWFIFSEPNNPIIVLTRDLLFNYWHKNNSLYHYFLFHFFFTMATEKYKDEWKKVPFLSNLPPLIMQREFFEKYTKKRFEQLKQMTEVHKLNYKYDKTQDKSGTILEHILSGEKCTN